MSKILQDVKLDFKDVLIRPKRSTLKSRAEVELLRTFTFKHSKQTLTCIPVIAANMDTVGTFSMAVAMSKHKLLTAVHKHYSIEEWKKFAKQHPDALQYVAVSSGISDYDSGKLSDILTAIPALNLICLDVANGYAQQFVDFVRKTRQLYPNKTIMAGNVVTGEMTEELILSGADIVKVGIGPGSVCTTRHKSGVGFPQLSAIFECADAAHGLQGMIVSDGGCVHPGDVCKALGANADFVMLGGMLCGHLECLPIEQQQAIKLGEQEPATVEFYGMSSAAAQLKHVGKVNEYRASEGKAVAVKYRGSVDVTVFDLLGGLRSCCTYVGAEKLKDLSKRTTFLRVTQQTNDIFGTSTEG